MSGEEVLSAVFVAILVAFYLMFLRPIQKDQEKHRQQIRDLRPGDEVVTTAGFLARVKDIQVQESGPAHIHLELGDGIVVKALPSAIAQRLPQPKSVDGLAAIDGTRDASAAMSPTPGKRVSS